jgi:hypothetical protein
VVTVKRPSPWVCGQCGLLEEEDAREYLRHSCHHCGKVLCGACAKYVDDPAFAGRPLSAKRQAVHCQACREKHHPAL